MLTAFPARAKNFLLTLGISACAGLSPTRAAEPPRPAVMEHSVIDEAGPSNLWGKCAADVNGDGRTDLLVGGWMGGGLVWYENPSWTKHVIDGASKISTDIELADVDRDGKPDIVAIVGKAGPVWYHAPEWTAHPITTDLVLHDIEVADFDGDGDIDIAGRNQNWSEKVSGAKLFILRQETPEKWTRETKPIPEGEGLAAADIDGDGDLDFVVNRAWIENRGDLLGGMPLHEYGPEWKHDATFVATGDLNDDGRTDIVLSPSEKVGSRYHISWFEAPADPKEGKWTEHVLAPDVETVHHFIGVADFNGDGFADVATAAMIHGAPPHNVTLYLNHGQGRGWTEQVIGSEGSHSMRIVDLDGTGPPSLFGANYRTSKVDLWRNATPHDAGAVAAATPASFAYILQADAYAKTKPAAVTRLAACGRDWVIQDAVFDSGTPWTREDLESIRGGKPGRKLIAYISIGEAEDYRPYWRKEWGGNGKLTPKAPAWLLPENPDWSGNYRVKYWRAEWQKLILATIEDAMARGFDGVYLDIVDGFETFEREGRDFIDDRLNPETRQSYRRDMVDWVNTIATRARSINPAALVIPQNGSQLLANDDFLNAISAIGVEDLFTEGNKVQPRAHTREVLGDLKKMATAGKPVLLIEYPKSVERQALSMKLAQENGCVWLITDRQLKTLGLSGQTSAARN